MPPKTPEPDSLASAMGVRLKERRTSLGLTLSEVGRRADVSVSYLSAVEAGSSSASLPVLARIARALDLTIGEFLAAETTSTVQRGHFGEATGAEVVSSSALQLQVAFHNAEAGGTGECPLPVGGGSVIAYIRTGEIDVEIDGETWSLGEGDSLHAQDPQHVRWSAPANASVVWTVAPSEAG